MQKDATKPTTKKLPTCIEQGQYTTKIGLACTTAPKEQLSFIQERKNEQYKVYWIAHINKQNCPKNGPKINK